MKRWFCILLIASLTLPLPACGEKPTPLDTASKAVLEGQSPDFDALQAEYPDIIAWLYIPGASVNAPVTSNGTGITMDTQSGEADFNAPVILFRGSISEGGAFRTLQKSFSTDECLKETVTLFNPEGAQTWQIFGAGAFREMDILKIYDNFRNRRNIPWFVDQWKQHHTMIRVVDENAEITEKDRLLILSTELSQTPGQCFLVLAKPVS